MEDLVKFFEGKKVFVTGHTGFKGSWLSLWLHLLRARVAGFSLGVPTHPSLFEQMGLAQKIDRSSGGDVRDKDSLSRALKDFAPEIVFHLAAQSLVFEGYEEPEKTFATNVLGTVNLLEGVRVTPSVKACLIATSDKCYEGGARLPEGFAEGDPLGGRDPYSASKACQEHVAAAYARAFNISLSTVRCGNVVGGGDWETTRIVPDCVRHLAAGRPIPLRMPQAVRPWQFVLDALCGYLTLARRQFLEPSAFAGPWNFGPSPESARQVSEVAQGLIARWGGGDWFSQSAAGANRPEAESLHLDASKARQHLQWRPLCNFEEMMTATADWYKASLKEPLFNAFDFSRKQILDYTDRTAQ